MSWHGRLTRYIGDLGKSRQAVNQKTLFGAENRLHGGARVTQN